MISTRNWRFVFVIVVGLCLTLGGCSVFRGIPTHGGGKRFDEEERAVSGSIRRALADMNLKELRGKTVLVSAESISHSGGGYVTFPGIQNVSGSYNSSDNHNGMNYADIAPIPGVYNSYVDNISNGLNHGGTASANPNLIFSSSVLGTDADFAYLRAALTMKLQHNGSIIVAASPDVALFVLVDVLGINRSRKDNFICWSDTLLASCELTYYALDAKTNKLLFRARQASASAIYRESSIIGFVAYHVDRSIDTVLPTAFAVDGEESTTTLALNPSPPLPTAPVKAAPPLPEDLSHQTMKQCLDTQLRNADLQVQVDNLGEAQRIVNAVRAVDANYPGLAEVDAHLQQRRRGERFNR